MILSPFTWIACLIPGKAITLKQVLSHTSGLPDIIDAKEDVLEDGDEVKAWETVKTLPLEFKAGEKFSYNQTGYVILGKIITKLSGMHFTKFIEDRQFKIAGMELTRFADSYDIVPNSAGAYTMFQLVNGRWIKNKQPGIAYMRFPVFFQNSGRNYVNGQRNGRLAACFTKW